MFQESCTCFNPVFMYLAETQFTDEVVRKLSDLIEKNIDTTSQPPVSVMYTGGTIRPMIQGSVDKVDAIGFHGGKVVATGSEPEVTTRMKELGTKYTTIKLSAGQTLLPGLIEPHVHIVPTALMMGWNDFGPFDGQDLRKGYGMDWLKEAVRGVKETALERMLDGWILGLGVDPSLMPFVPSQQGSLAKLQSFTCETVDKLEKDTPLLMISASMHTAYVNTRALKLIYESSSKMHKKYSTFDKFLAHVDSAGGLQELKEMIPALLAIPKWQLLEMVLGVLKHLKCLFKTANQRGVTLMYDAGMLPLFKIVLDIYFFGRAKDKVRIGYAELCRSADAAEKLPNCNPMTEFKNLYRGSVKLISDGSNQGLTGFQNEAYCCEPPNNKGFFNFPSHSTPDNLTPEYLGMIENVVKKEWPLMIHANGDKAIDFALEAYKIALAGSSGMAKRHRIEHCSLLSQENLARMADMGISPSFLIGHVGYWGYVFRNAIFEEKAEHLDLCKSALDKKMRITLHSDNAVSPLGPLRMMEQSITRIMEGDPDGKVLNPNEKITPEKALRAVSYDAAWQCHADQWVGSLEEGKFADYVILAEDPITRRNPVGMRNISVLETWIGGIRMH